MKQLTKNKYAFAALGMIVAVLLMLLGKGADAHGATLASAGLLTLTEAEKEGLSENEQKVMLAVKKMTAQVKEDLLNGTMSKKDILALIGTSEGETEAGKSLKAQIAELAEIARKQGTSLQEMAGKINGAEAGNKSISQVLEENVDELKRVFQNGSGQKHFMINVNHKGELVMRPFDPTKAAGPHAASANVGGAGNTASIAQSIDAASLLRLGGNAAILGQYRNTPWLLELTNMINAGYDMPFAMWYDEQAKQGGSSTVAEGAAKPLSQYAYTLRTASYKKEATLIGFTDEFALDFARLQSDIMGKGRTDLYNRINSAVLTNVVAAATAYNTAASYKQGAVVANANDFDVLAAMAAQVDSATFGTSNANAALMSTFKRYRMGMSKDTTGNFISRPAVLDNLQFVGNSDLTADQVVVGDLKQYNVIMRGGLIVKVGYNGTDFAENKFSVVMEQFYYDYISSLRTPAIVKGPDFATVKTAITT